MDSQVDLEHIFRMPISQFLGIVKSKDPNFTLELPSNEKLLNHLHTIHASVLNSFAEITSGAFLNANFPGYEKTTVPILRKAKGKYSSPSNERLFSRSKFLETTPEQIDNELKKFGKSLFTIQAEIVNQKNKLVFRGEYEWFVLPK